MKVKLLSVPLFATPWTVAYQAPPSMGFSRQEYLEWVAMSFSRRPRLDSWVRKIPWRRDRLPTSVFLGFPGGSDGKESACSAGELGSIPGQEDPLRRAWQPTPVFLAGESLWTEEPGGLQSMGLQRVGHY